MQSVAQRTVLLVLALALAAPARAQQAVEWSTIDGGGGRSGGGVYALHGSIGQVDADVVSLCSDDGGAGCSNPRWALTGGFWAGTARAPATGCGADSACVFRDGFE